MISCRPAVAAVLRVAVVLCELDGLSRRDAAAEGRGGARRAGVPPARTPPDRRAGATPADRRRDAGAEGAPSSFLYSRYYTGGGIYYSLISAGFWWTTLFPALAIDFIVKTTASSLESFREVTARGPDGPMLVSTVDAWCAAEDFARFAGQAAARPDEATVLAVTPLVDDEKQYHRLVSFFTRTAPELVDRVAVFLAPMLLGGREAPTMIGGLGRSLPRAMRLTTPEVTRLGNDILVEADLARERPA